MTIALWAVGSVLVACLFAAFGAIFLKKGADSLSLTVSGLLGNTYLFKGVIFYGLATCFFIYGLTGGELSLLYPLASTTYILISFLSVQYLGERMNSWKWAGIFLIFAGVTLIGVGSNGA